MLQNYFKALLPAASLLLAALPVAAQSVDYDNLQNNPDVKVYWRVNPDNDDTNPGTNAIDGNSDTFYKYNGGWSNNWVIVDLGKEYVIKSVTTTWANIPDTSDGRYRIAYIGDTLAESALENSDLHSDNVCTTEDGWTREALETSRIQNGAPVSTWTASGKILARYVAVRDTHNPQPDMGLAEIVIRGVENEAPKAASVTFLPYDNYVPTFTESTIKAEVYDQYGDKMDVAQSEISYRCLETGGSSDNNIWWSETPGVYTIQAVCGEAKASTEFVVITDLVRMSTPGEGETRKNFFKEAYLGETSLDVNTHGLFVHKHDPAARVNQVEWSGEAVSGNPDDGYEYAPLTIRFVEPINIELFELHWEVAAPADYKVLTSLQDGSKELEVLSVEGRNYADGYFPVDRVCSASKLATLRGENGKGNNIVRYAPSNQSGVAEDGYMKGVTEIQIVPTAANNPHGWTMKLQGMNLYATDANGVPTEVETIVAAEDDAEAPVEYYTLQGVRVTAPSAPGIYIRRQGNKVIKLRSNGHI